MKRKLFIAIVISVAFAASVVGYKVSCTANMSDLMTANVEALVQAEAGGGTCYNSIHAKDGSLVIYCPVCSWVPGAADLLATKRECGK